MTYGLMGCVAVLGSNSLVLGPIAPAVAASLGSPVSSVMTATAAFGLGTAASAVFLARHIDRLGTWRMVHAAIAVLAAALLVSALAPNILVLVAGQLIAGLATGVALPAIYSTAAAIAPPGRESRTIGIVLTGWTLSLIVGVSLSAVLADYLHWRAVYVVIATLSLIVLVTLWRRTPLRAPTSGAASAPMPLEALKIAGVTPLLVACGLFMSAFYGLYGFLGDHLHHGLGQPVSANGLAALVYGVGFGSAVLLDRIVDRVGAQRLMPLAFLAVSAVYVVMAFASESIAGVLIGVGLWGLANHVGLNVLIMRLAAIDPSRRGTIMGLNSAVTYLAVCVGTTGFGAIFTTFGFVTSALVAASLTATAAVVGAWRDAGSTTLAFSAHR